MLNRFDNILEQVIQEYGLRPGPQTKPFGRVILEKDTAAGQPSETTARFEHDGDRRLVDNILVFSRLLLENCGNRSLYNSSDRIGDLLNTTSIPLLSTALNVAVRLAQRYYASRQRGATASLQHLNNALLASHYNIDLEKVQKIANPFSKPFPAPTGYVGSDLTATPSVKGKERAHQSITAQPNSTSSVHAHDLLAIAKGEEPPSSWDAWSGVQMTYYQSSLVGEEKGKTEGATDQTESSQSRPSTPTPVRRASALSRPSPLSNVEDTTETPVNTTTSKTEHSSPGGTKHIEIPFPHTSSTSVESLMTSAISEVPKEHQYELLNKVRIAYSMVTSPETRREMLGIRILAITNLAYIYPETVFQQKVLQNDSDEPRRLQLVYQLASLVHPPGKNKASIPIELQTIALGALEALAKHKSRASDVSAALSVNVNHGVLLHLLRKAVADLGVEDVDEGSQGDSWREALFSLLEALPASSPRTGETLIAAGLLDILIESLTLRTEKAERTHPKVLTFLNSFVYTVRDAFQTLANSRGLDTISDLAAYEVQSSLQRANNGMGLPPEYRNQVIDYQVPYFQQQTLRWVLKFVNHMMQHGSGNFERLLRNLIDSPQLLSGLRTIIGNAKVFGSNVWSGAINIMSSFIHNEPTSYAVIAEAGLSKGFLESLTLRPINDNAEQPPRDNPTTAPFAEEENAFGDNGPTVVPISKYDPISGAVRKVKIQREDAKPLAAGILPATDAIVTVPTAFGAICLNSAGTELFLASGALDSFFEIFESADHVKTMTSDMEVARLIGSNFDELVRHHPRLRQAVMSSVNLMVARVGSLCRSRAANKGVGAKLWTQDANERLRVIGGTQALIEDPSLKPTTPTESGSLDIPMDTTMGGVDAAVGSESALKMEDVVDQEHEKEGPSVTAYINVAMKFLAGYFENNTLCSSFVEIGGLDFVLDFATMPCLPHDFNDQAASHELARVVHMLAEQKPHLVLPSLLKRTQQVTDVLEPFFNHEGKKPFLSAHVNPNDGSAAADEDLTTSARHIENGTLFVKSLVALHTLCSILYEVFQLPIYNPRSSHTVFTQVNLADVYNILVTSLGLLHQACVWEGILLNKAVPAAWKEASSFKGLYGIGHQDADRAFEFIDREQEDASISEILEVTAGIADATTTTAESSSTSVTQAGEVRQSRKPSGTKEKESAKFKNIRTLRYLLCQVPASITAFFQALGKALIAKRRNEPYQRQTALGVADSLADAVHQQLFFPGPTRLSSDDDRYAYLMAILPTISHLMVANGPLERPQPHCLTLVLQAFKNRGGLATLKTMLQGFVEDINNYSPTQSRGSAQGGNTTPRAALVYRGINLILNLFTQITTTKSITEASQTIAIQSSSDRDRGQPHYFATDQFLVEIRMAVLPVVRSIWDSDYVDNASDGIIKSLIEILRINLDCELEENAYKREEPPPNRSNIPFKPLPIATDKVTSLVDQRFDSDLAREALYRCFNNANAAAEYCRVRVGNTRLSRHPIPSFELDSAKTSTPRRTPQRQDSDDTLPDTEPMTQDDEPSSPAANPTNPESGAVDSVDTALVAVEPPPPAPGVPPPTENEIRDMTNMSMEDLLSMTENLVNESSGSQSAAQSTPMQSESAPTSSQGAPKGEHGVTLEDLEEERAKIRRNLIDRALDVLNVHSDVTFELSDLITAAASKTTEVSTMRREIGETLVQSLISFQMGEDFRPAGKKIAAYANLLALVLQDRNFFEATQDELRDNFGSLLGFVKIFPDQPGEEPSPWIGQILLIIEKILAEDVQPQQIQWIPPTSDNPQADASIVAIDEPIIPQEDKSQLFEAIIEIMPRIGKDESLALSVLRILVILTRNREIAAQLGEKRNMQRLLVMVKQLAGTMNERVQTAFMLVLRHIIEDADILRQIIRVEIVKDFEARPSRPTDVTTYVRQMYHHVIRAPDIFVEITNEKLKLQRFESGSRPQNLVLRPEPKSDTVQPTEKTENGAEASTTGEGQAAPAKTKVTDGDIEEGIPAKPKSMDVKAPVVEHPDGVIHYLLCELLSYKDVEDKDPLAPPKELKEPTDSDAIIDVAVDNIPAPSTPAIPLNTEGSESKRTEKVELKLDQHPIHAYRCFILQCLTELLYSYNRTKIEFVNFSRKADPRAMTPSKPRSGVLNYLLNVVVPHSTLEHETTVAALKKASISSWAMAVIVTLCLKTTENGYDKKTGTLDENEEPDLLFVRKFVLEHALKAYKDTSTSEEPLDPKYARMLSLADLFNRLVTGTIIQGSVVQIALSAGPQKPIAKIMFEKNFINALTSSIAEIDLNFPNSKRAVKYILRPLKELTHIALELSESGSITTTPSQSADEDEISTASSVSEVEMEREMTPDLFRNSTLGMFEPGREEETSSESSDDDEEMYDEEYDDGMDYEEEIERDGDEVVSDEEEEIEGIGPVEGLPGDGRMDVEVVIDDDEPSDDEDDRDDSEDMDDMEDEMGEEVEVIDEITGDNENDSLADGDEEEWQDEDDAGHEYDGRIDIDNELSQDPDADHESAVRDIVREFGGAGAALERLELGHGNLAMDMDDGTYMEEAVDDGDEGEDDEDEDVEEDDLIYHPEDDEDVAAMGDSSPWGWDPDDDPGMRLPRGPHHHHHHHTRRTINPWSVYPNLDPGDSSERVPMFRSHRPGGASRGVEDGTNPLLQRSDRPTIATGATRIGIHTRLADSIPGMGDLIQQLDMHPRDPLAGENPVSFVNNIIAAAIGQGGTNFGAMSGPGGALHLHFATPPGGGRGTFGPRELQSLFRGPPRELTRVGREDSNPAFNFVPAATTVRWHHEARVLFGNSHHEKALRIVNTILRLLVPPAIEEQKKKDEKDAEDLRLIAEEREKQLKLKEERLAKQKAEQEAHEARNREAAAAAAAEAEAARVAQEADNGDSVNSSNAEAMEGVEATQTIASRVPMEATEGNAAVGNTSTTETNTTETIATPAIERVTTTIRGREVDITNMGIDLEYLEALPQELREEVLMQQLATQRSQAAASGQEPTDISREFLEALPPEIREELLQQEAQDRRRREREENRRRAAASGGPAIARAEEMDPASFLASLDPSLRQAVLMEQDEEVLAHLPSAIAAEARALGGHDRLLHRLTETRRATLNRATRLGHDRGDASTMQANKKPQRRQIVQMLDKAGVATLLRLMFVSQQGSSRQSLNGILHDVSANRQNRAEIVSLLLSILQDGSADLHAVERSFANLTLRAKQPGAQKTPQPLKRAPTGLSTSPANTEMTPLMVIQQCLNALVFLTQYNPHIPSFFLTEHEVTPGLKNKSGRKGKGKDAKTSKYALNALLSLLDRKIIMESSSCMELLSNLLQSVTHPLTLLLRKDREKSNETVKAGEISSEPALVNGADPAPTTDRAVPISLEPSDGDTLVAEPRTDVPAALTDHLNSVAMPAIDPSQGIAPSAQYSLLDPTGIAQVIASNTSENLLANPPPVTETQPESAKTSIDDEKVRKQRNLTPPVVPESNLRLVVNILAARECSAKTFRDTLSTINNLSAIPDAKDIFGKELIKQAQDLGRCISQDLDDITNQIQNAESGTDIQGMALAKFSPSSSDQAKLLRVLTALDYLFDPKRNADKTKAPLQDTPETGESSTPKEDMLTTLYENSTFGPLWVKLSECLRTIRQRGNMLSAATILLPLIEALMVICKNTTAKEVPLARAVKESSVTSSPPESGVENLFFRFTEEHRKILNDLVRNNPKLMSGTFSLLVKNPKVLEFDNKRNYFTRRLHSRGSETRHTQPPLQLQVRRQEVFLDSFKSLYFKSGDEMKYGKLNIRFHGEEGVDAGGVTREWFQVLSRQMFNPDYALFIPVASDRTTFHPNKLSSINQEHLMFFKFIGRVIGKALYEGRALDCHFSRAVYKRILGKTVSVKDMETLDLDYYKSLLWMLENDIAEIITETFSIETEAFGVTEIVDLVENGRNIPVTDENKQEYVQLVVEYRLTGSVKEQLEEFLKGMHLCLDCMTVY